MEGPVLDIAKILAALPHRYPFLLVDRVVEIERGTRIRAIKNVTCNEPFFAGHWPGRSSSTIPISRVTGAEYRRRRIARDRGEVR